MPIRKTQTSKATQASQVLRLPAVLSDRPWFIAPEALRGFIERTAIRGAAIARMDMSAIDAAVAASAAAPLGRLVGSVAVIPITGCITQKQDFYSWYFGGTSVERLSASFRQYLADPNVSAIVFDVDSPGGEVYGVPECFAELFAARGTKTTIAVSNPFMASAAYWLSCACDEVYLLPSGQAGSVGCYTMHEDYSKFLERIGISVTFVQYGEHKTDGNGYEPLSESARAELQASVDFYGSWFDKSVAKARGIDVADVKERFGQGRVLRAPEAKKVGMVDKIGSLADVLAKLAPARARVAMSASLVEAAPALLAGCRAALGAFERQDAINWDELAAAVTLAERDPAPCPACKGTRLNLETYMGDPAGQEACTACGGTGTVAAAAEAEGEDTVEPTEDGTCPDGYEVGDDGKCHLKTDDAKATATAAAQRQADRDALDVGLALTE